MELWVRSQNGILLTKEINVVRIEKNERKVPISEEEKGRYDPNEIIENHFVGMPLYYVKKTYWYILCNKCPVAQYSSEEKALKVLDRLEKHIDRITVIGYNEDSIWRLNKMVFQMPKDNEVEEYE